jgi:hypothetical protein
VTTLIRTLVAAAVIAALAAPVVAQEYSDPRGFRLKRTPTDPRDAAASAAPEQTLMRTARCIAEDRPEQVRAYLASVPGSADETATFAEIEKKVTRCMPEMDMSMVGNATRARGTMTMRFDHSALRGALAESMLREEEVSIAPEALALGDDGMFVAERFHGARSTEIDRVFALGFAGCVMGNNAAAMQGLFATKPGSAEERAAILSMAPSFGQCVMEGHQVKLSAPTLRNQLAETVYYAINVGKAS